MSHPPSDTDLDLTAVLRNAAEPLYVVNAARRLIFFNHGCERLLGVTAEKVLGTICRFHGPFENTDPADIASALCPPPEAFTGTPCQARRLIPTPQGRTVLMTVHFSPLHTSDGALAAIVGMLRPDETPKPEELGGSLPEQLALLRYRLRERYRLDHFIANDPAMRRVLEQARLAAAAPVHLTITGEPGCGRRHLARVIHGMSATADRACLLLECASSPEVWLEEQLSEEGLLAEPASDRGRWGTLILVEPYCLSRHLQRRVAEFVTQSAASDARRLIAASDRSWTELREREGCLPELAECLSTLVIEIPPLRARPADIPLLVQWAVERHNAEGERQMEGIEAAALERLQAYSWPGNVAQLIEVVRQACARCTGCRLRTEDLPVTVQMAGQPARPKTLRPLPLDDLLQEAEKRLLQLALEEEGGNLSRAAARLGISTARLLRRLRHLGLRTSVSKRS